MFWGDLTLFQLTRLTTSFGRKSKHRLGKEVRKLFVTAEALGGMEDKDWELLHSGSPQDKQRFFEKAAGFLIAEGGEHWSCHHPYVVQEVLWLWQFSHQASVQFLRNSLAKQASQCSACATAVHRCRAAAVSALDSQVGSSYLVSCLVLHTLPGTHDPRPLFGRWGWWHVGRFGWVAADALRQRPAGRHFVV